MDLHPVFVHFPIAFLTVYALMEFVRFKIGKSNFWLYTKASLLFVGVAGSLPAYKTGEIAEDLNVPSLYSKNLVEIHATFAKGTLVFFGVLTAIYFVLVIQRNEKIKSFLPSFVNALTTALSKIYYSPFGGIVMILLATGGLILLTITGGLGGLIVYGPDADPLARFLYEVITP